MHTLSSWDYKRKDDLLSTGEVADDDGDDTADPPVYGGQCGSQNGCHVGSTHGGTNAQCSEMLVKAAKKCRKYSGNRTAY